MIGKVLIFLNSGVSFLHMTPRVLSYKCHVCKMFQFSSVAQSLLTLCDPMDCSTSGFPVHHQLPELAQTHLHGVSDAIQPSHPLLSPSPPVINLSQHQGFSNESALSSSGQSVGSSASASNEYSGLSSFRINW